MKEKAVVPVPLGCIAVEKYTGYTGLVIAVYEHVTGCDTRSLEPLEAVDGELGAAQTFDVSKLTAVDDPRQLRDMVVAEPQIAMETVVKDVVTGVEGVVVARATNLFEGPEVLIQPCGLTKKKAPMRCLLLPEIRVTVLSEPKPAKAEEPKATEKKAVEGGEPVKKGGMADIGQYRRH